MTRGKKLALTTPKDRTTVKSKGFGAAHSAVVKKNSEPRTKCGRRTPISKRLEVLGAV